MHAVYQPDPDGDPHNWIDATFEQEADSAFNRTLWEQHEAPLLALLPELSLDQATPYNCLGADLVTQMTEFGHEIVGGGRHEVAVAWLGHHPFHPWRIGDDYLEEDLDSPVLIVHHQPQFGEAGDHGPMGGRVFEDQTLPHMQVQFLQVYLNRMYAERSGQADDRVWLFGFLTHDNQSDADRRVVIEEWLAWLTENFGNGRTSLRGNPIIQFSTFREVAGDFSSWEVGENRKSSRRRRDAICRKGSPSSQGPFRIATYPVTFIWRRSP
jgi:hypothetical protein